MSFRDSEGGSVTEVSVDFEDVASLHNRDSAHTVKSVLKILTVENLTEDIEVVEGGVKDDRDLVEISPRGDDVFEGILVEVIAFDNMINAITREEVVVVVNGFKGAVSSRLHRGGDGDLREGVLFLSGSPSGRKVFRFFSRRRSRHKHTS